MLMPSRHHPLTCFLVLSLAAAILFPSMPARCGPGDEEEKGRTILIDSLEKRGGRKALEAIKDYELLLKGTGKASSGAVRQVTTTRKVLYGKEPCLIHDSVIKAGGSRYLARFTLKGSKGYYQTKFGGQPLHASAVAKQWAGHHRSSLGILRVLLTPEIKVDYVGKGEVREKTTEVIRIRRKGEPPLKVDVDPETGFFLRVRWKERPKSGAPPEPHEILYGDFQDFGGLKGIPARAEVRISGGLVMSRKTGSAKVNTGLKPSDFKMP